MAAIFSKVIELLRIPAVENRRNKGTMKHDSHNFLNQSLLKHETCNLYLDQSRSSFVS